MEWPPTTLHFASAIFERPPRIICSRISGSPLSGKPTMESAETGSPPMAYTSLNAFAAAICPKVYGSSTMGVKKSTVWTSAISGLSRYTPASSLVSKPTSTFGSLGRGKRRKTESSNPGLSFAAQPAALTMAFQWSGVAVGEGGRWAQGLTGVRLGLTIPDRSRMLVASIVGGGAIAALQWLNLRRVGELPVEARGSLGALAERILPQSTVE